MDSGETKDVEPASDAIDTVLGSFDDSTMKWTIKQDLTSSHAIKDVELVELDKGKEGENTILDYVMTILEQLSQENRLQFATYMTIKSRCLQHYTRSSFDQHKSKVQALLKDFSSAYLKDNIFSNTEKKKKKKKKEEHQGSNASREKAGFYQIPKLTKSQIRSGKLNMLSISMTKLWLNTFLHIEYEGGDDRSAVMKYTRMLENTLGKDEALRFETAQATENNERKKHMKVGSVVRVKTFVRGRHWAFLYAEVLRIDSDSQTADLKLRLRSGLDKKAYGVPFSEIVLHDNSDSGNRVAKLEESVHWFGGEYESLARWSMLFDNYHIESMQRISIFLASSFPDISGYCPQVPSIVGIMLNLMREEYVVAALTKMISHSKKYLVTEYTNESREHVVYALLRIVKRYASSNLWRAIVRCRQDAAAKGVVLDCMARFLWGAFHRMLAEYLGSNDQVQLMTLYLNEDKKILYRFVVALLLSESNEISKCRTEESLETVLESMKVGKGKIGRSEGRFQRLAKIAFRLRRLKREHIHAYLRDAEMKSDGLLTVFEKHTDEEIVPFKINYRPNVSGLAMDGTGLIDEDLVLVVQSLIPRQHQVSDFQLIFATANDGFKLDTLYSKCQDYCGPMFCVVRPVCAAGDEKSAPLVGAFSSRPFSPNESSMRTNSGNPEIILFRLRPDPTAFEIVNENDSGDAMELSPWSRSANFTSELFQIGIPKSARIASSGLLLDAALNTAMCGPCDVFGGAPALGPEYEEFTVGAVEVYGLYLS